MVQGRAWSLRVWVAAMSLGWLLPAAAFSEPSQFLTDDAAVGRIFELADQRLGVMPAVAAVKWQTHAPIFDPPRENAVIQRAQDLGAPMGLAADPLGRLFELQARLAREVRKRSARALADQKVIHRIQGRW